MAAIPGRGFPRLNWQEGQDPGFRSRAGGPRSSAGGGMAVRSGGTMGAEGETLGPGSRAAWGSCNSSGQVVMSISLLSDESMPAPHSQTQSYVASSRGAAVYQ